MINYKNDVEVEKNVNKLNKGDVVELHNSNYAFIRILRGGKNWYGFCLKLKKQVKIKITDDNLKVIGNVKLDGLMKKESKVYNNFERGDLFSIPKRRNKNKSDKFRFIKETDDGVIAVRMSNKQKVRIDKGFPYEKLN